MGPAGCSLFPTKAAAQAASPSTTLPAPPGSLTDRPFTGHTDTRSCQDFPLGLLPHIAPCCPRQTGGRKEVIHIQGFCHISPSSAILPLGGWVPYPSHTHGTPGHTHCPHHSQFVKFCGRQTSSSPPVKTPARGSGSWQLAGQRFCSSHAVGDRRVHGRVGSENRRPTPHGPGTPCLPAAHLGLA